MVMGLTVTVSAAQGTNDNSGKITIDNAVVGQTYTIYQILTLESYNANATTGAYSYKATTAWSNFINQEGIKDVYVSVDGQGYVTWKTGADVATFAKAAQKYVKDNSISGTSITKGENTSVEFTDLNLGYYLVDSTLGTLCSLDTTNPIVTIEEKNGVPTNDKMVQEDSKVGTNDEYGKSNDADINQEVKFQSTITAQDGAENYVFHDTMSAGLTFGSVTGITLNGTAVAKENYEVKTTGFTDGCTFEVVFKQKFCNTLNANDKIVISYTATLNANAVVGLPGNPNESKLSYGDSSNTKYTPVSETITYTWDMDVLKYANGVESNVLAGAEFKLLNNDKSKAAEINIDENSKIGKFVKWVDIAEGTTLTTDENGKIAIDGLDADTYYLRETKAPDGYNKLKDDEKVIITGATKDENSGKLTYTTVIAKINNNSGTELPSTGGMGTTIFYVIGSILVLGAAVLLVTRKRMNA